MSGNARAPKKRIDERVRRTRDRLGDAIIDLIQKQPFDTIKVQDVLDRAGVARSTFYEHFSDKDDLLHSDMDEFLEGMATALSRGKAPSDRVAPVKELFAHVAEMRTLYAAMVASGKIHDFLELGQGHFARGIERRLKEIPRARGLTAKRRAALAPALAGALLSLLTWWLDRGAPGSPAEMDDLYHRMVWSGVSAKE
jgi:AcrR family transcriptional regulator